MSPQLLAQSRENRGSIWKGKGMSRTGSGVRQGAVGSASLAGLWLPLSEMEHEQRNARVAVLLWNPGGQG